MQNFEFTVTDSIGIHARPAALLSRAVKPFQCKATIACNGKEVELDRTFMVMGLCVECGDTVHFSAEGKDEQEAIEAIRQVCLENLTKEVTS